jgi:hypothetical protein
MCIYTRMDIMTLSRLHCRIDKRLERDSLRRAREGFQDTHEVTKSLVNLMNAGALSITTLNYPNLASFA